MAEPRSWIREDRQYHLDPIGLTDDFERLNLLTAEYETIDTPAGFKIELLPHQKVIVRAMYDLERVRYIKITDLAGPFEQPYGHLETCAGVLSDKLGSGKTYDILALISHGIKNRMPKTAIISSLPTPGQESRMEKSSNYKNRQSYKHLGWKTEVRRMYRKSFPLSLVFVNKAVLLQWRDAITLGTNLRAFVIDNVSHLKEFYEAFFSPKNAKNTEAKFLASYDLVLIKNGKISGVFEPPELAGTFLEGVGSRSILAIFGELFKDVCFERVVLDDFDTLKINSNAYVIPAQFTWFVSATKKQSGISAREYPAKSNEEIALYYRPSYISAWKNRDLFTFCNLRCETEFIDHSTNACMVSFSMYKFVNANERYIGLLGTMGTDDARLIMEALNGDAVNTAASAVGIKSTSVADIFERILGDKQAIYKKNIEVEQYLQVAREYVIGLPERSAPYGAVVLDVVRRNLRKPGPFEKLRAAVTYQDYGVRSTIDEVDTENMESKELNGRALKRVQDNLREGECPIMAIPLRECEGVIILKCCGITISTEAATFSLRLSRGHKLSSEIAGSCPQCRATISFSQLILIDKEISIDDIVQEKLEPAPQLPVESEAQEDKLDKYKCIIRIIEGTDTGSDIEEVRSDRDVHISSMLRGARDAGIAPASARKVIVYASHAETLDNVAEKLIDRGIGYARVQGTARQIKEMTDRYKLPNENPESLSVLLIQGAEYCAGLNLQCTTDLIFSHMVLDKNVESQVAGRAARFGREYNLRIHYVLYENEVAQMFPAPV